MIDLSVIIVNWNTRELLRNCLISLREHLEALSVEVFVVDNGSNDGSIEMTRTEFPEVVLIENGENLGFARANNLAMKRAAGRFFLLLNSDTIVRAGAIEGLIETMEGDSSIGIAGLQLLNEDGSLQNSISNYPSLLSELSNKSLLRLLFPSAFPGKERLASTPLQVQSVIGACMLVRREAAEEVGLLDEDYFFFLEETDWCLRMHQAGWKVVHDPRYAIYHLQGKSAGKVNVRARIEYWRSRYAYFRKHFGVGSRIALGVGLMFRLSISLLSSLLANLFTGFLRPKMRRKLAVYWKVLLWHLAGCPDDGGLSQGRQALPVRKK